MPSSSSVFRNPARIKHIVKTVPHPTTHPIAKFHKDNSNNNINNYNNNNNNNSTDNPVTPSSSGPYTAATYARRADHTANTADPQNEHSYILSLHTDPDHKRRLTALRTKYFPVTLNKVDAHVALFHALPGSKLDTIITDILSITQYARPFPIRTGPPFLIGKRSVRRGGGVAVTAVAPLARIIHRQLKSRWNQFLSRQDKTFHPHYTIQNRVRLGAVPTRTLEEVKVGFEGSRGRVDGLVLWRYDKGYWRRVRDFMFDEV